MKIENFINLFFDFFLFFKKNDYSKFVFYSEGGFYTKYYSDLACELNKHEKILVLTSDVEEKKYFNNLKIDCLYLGNGEIRKYILNNIKCDFLIITLTDIGQNFKKSPYVKKYVYYFHSLASIHKIYKKEAFNNYDIFFVNGEYQIKELKKLEEIFKLKKKEIVKTGYFYLNYLKKNSNLNITKKRQILYAPSWNYESKNLFNDYSIKIINDLITNDFQVVLRPHFEHYKRSNNIIKNIKKKFLNNKSFKLDDSFDNLKSLEESEVLITDNSSIALEFGIIFEKQSVYINYIDKKHNETYEKYNFETFEEVFKKQLGRNIDVKNLNNLPNLCNEILKDKNFPEKIQNFSTQNLYDADKSIRLAIKYLLSQK